MSIVDVCVIGAGPYGLSAATHLAHLGFSVRIFGEPMEFWASKMPEGMLLRSPRVASNISDPTGSLTLERYEAAVGLSPAAPVPLDTFVSYGRWLSQLLKPILDTRAVLSVERDQSYFRLKLLDGDVICSRRVVVAAGIGPFANRPEVFADLSPAQVSHCYDSRDVKSKSGKRVAVIGAGQSALESAALLSEAGAEVEIIARLPELRFIGMHGWLHGMGPISKLLYSSHDVGPIGVSRLVAYPTLVSYLPLQLRDKIRTRAVRSAGSRWLPERLKRVTISTSRFVTKVTSGTDEVRLVLNDGTERAVDHVLLGTGYRVDISKYSFLTSSIVADIAQFDGYPRLRSGFRTSVPGLHFIGAPAARSFGPLLYFVAGTEFASRELSSHLLRERSSTTIGTQSSAAARA